MTEQELRELIKSQLGEVIKEENEKALLNENKGRDLADKYVAILRKEFRKLNDDELEEFNKTIAYAFGYTVEAVTEASRGKVHKAVKNGSYPVTIVVISNGMAIKQELVKTPEAVPAAFNELQKQYPNANLSIEDNTGKRLFSESVNEGKNFYQDIIDGLKLSFKTFFEAGVESDYKMFEKFWKRDYKDLINAAEKIEMFKESLTEATDLNDPFMVRVRVMRQIARDKKEYQAYKKANPTPKARKISFDKYLSLLDLQSGHMDDLKDLTRQLKQTDADMNTEAGEKGDEWTDDDGNRYGGILMDLEVEYEKVKAKLAKVEAKIDKYNLQ